MKLYAHSLVLTCALSMARVWVHATSMDRMKITEPSVLLEEGRPAEIPCLTIGRHDAYIWMKGYSIENSTELASFIDGIASEDTSHFTVSENGTLLIEKVRLKDEGKYLCRASSEISDCTGEIMVYVQAVLDKFALGVDLCQSKSNCAIFIDPSQAIAITCRANNAPHSMDLKWFNGSREITDDIVLGSREVQGGLSHDITSTLNIVDTHPSLLTCQAVDQKRRNDEGLFVNVQLKAPVTSAKPSPAWMVVSIILLIICLATAAVIAIMTVRLKKQPRQTDTGKQETVRLLEEKSSIVKEKDVEIQGLKSEQENKDAAIQRLEEEKRSIVTEKDVKIQGLTVNIKTKEAEINHEKITKKKIIEDLKEELKRLKQQLEEMMELKDEGMKGLNNQMIERVRTKEEEIKDLNHQMREKVKTKEEEIKDLNTRLAHLSQKLQSSSNETEQKEETFRALKEQFKATIDAKERTIEDMKSRLAVSNSKLQSSDEQAHQKEESIKNLTEKLKKTTEELSRKESKWKKYILDTERERRALRQEKMQLKDTVQFVCKIIPSAVGKEQIKRTETSAGWTVKNKELMNFMVKSFKFNLTYTTRRENDDVSQAISDLIQNAIDGGSSCILSYASSGKDHIVTMAGSSDDRKQGIIMFSSQRLFETVAWLKNNGIEVKLLARYLTEEKAVQGDPAQSYFIDFHTKKECSNFSKVEKINLSDFDGEKTLEQYLMDIKEKTERTSPDFMVEYYIESANNHPRTLGKISLVTLCGPEQLKVCFRSESSSTSKLATVVSETIYNGNCYSLLVTHLSEENKDETKKTLETMKKIQETEKSLLRSMRKK